MSEVRKRKGNNERENVAKKIGSSRKEAESPIKLILRYALIAGAIALCIHLSPYEIKLVPKSGLFSSPPPGKVRGISSNRQKMA